MPRTGRPKSESPKQRSLSLRVDDAEYEKLKDYAAKHDMTITQVLQRVLKFNTQWKKGSSSTKYLFPFERKEQRWQKQEKTIEGGLYGKEKSSARINHICIPILILMGKGGIYMRMT